MTFRLTTCVANNRLRYLRVSCVNSLTPLNKAAVELVDEMNEGESHADWLLSLVDYRPGFETLIINAHVFNFLQEGLANFFGMAVCLNHCNLLSPRGRICVCAGVLRLLARLSNLRILRLDHTVARQDADILLYI